MARPQVAERVVARRPFGYGGAELDWGQVTELRGLENDEKLTRLGYFESFTGRETYTCAECGSEFVGVAHREKHGSLRHRPQPLDPAEQDRLEEREEKRLEATSPLYLEKTTASQRG